MAIEKLTKAEIEAMNEIIIKAFGVSSKIEAGSKEQRNSKFIYHVVIGDPVNTKSDSLLKRIGKTLSEEYDSAAEYYYFGTRIA